MLTRCNGGGNGFDGERWRPGDDGGPACEARDARLWRAPAFVPIDARGDGWASETRGCGDGGGDLNDEWRLRCGEGIAPAVSSGERCAACASAAS